MQRLRDPILLIPLLFAAAILIGALILSLPFATASGQSAPFLTALFTSTSAVAVTGLIVVDTPVYWSLFGQVAILIMFQIGGFGIMTAATLFGIMVGRGFGVRDHARTQGGTGGGSRPVTFPRSCVWCSRSRWRWKGVVAVVLGLRFAFGYDFPPLTATWHGLFHSVSAFNNAGFSSFSDSVMGFQGDPVVLGPIALSGHPRRARLFR